MGGMTGNMERLVQAKDKLVVKQKNKISKLDPPPSLVVFLCSKENLQKTSKKKKKTPLAGSWKLFIHGSPRAQL